MYLLAHLSRWLDEQGLGVADLVIGRGEPFSGARRTAGVTYLRTQASLVPLLRYLRSLGVLADAEASAPSTEAERLSPSRRFG